MNETILVVDDEEALAEGLRYNLEREGFRVSLATRGTAALDAVASAPPDLVLLDVMLPDLDGFEVCRQLRARDYQGPVILLTARDRELDRVVGLEIGADDYVTKPFSTAELVARVRAHLRRERRLHARAGQEPEKIRLRHLTIDALRREVRAGEVKLDLTLKEFELLLHLAQRPDRVVRREELLESLWGYDYDGDSHVVSVTVQRLRDKIEMDPRAPKIILTVRGIGYRVDPGP